jgi:GT2 family glycosyltransferase
MSISRVTAVVLNYNGRHLLDTIVPSLLAQTYGELRAVVLDDGSTDGSGEYVRSRWPTVEVVELGQNVGITAALNRAVELATGEYVALLNNDLELDPNWVTELVRTLDEHPNAGSVTGKMLDFYNRSMLDGAGDSFMWSSAAQRRGFRQPDRGQFDQPSQVFSPCAGAALFRRVTFEDVGGFDPDFFAYLEDVDWGFRAQLRGWQSHYEPRALAFHMGGATTGQNPRLYGGLQRRNQLLLIVKNYPARAIVRHWPKIVLHHGGWVAASIRDRMFLAHLSAWWMALRALPAALCKRRAIQRARRVDLAYLESIISPEPYAGDTAGQRVRSIASAAAPIFRRARR